MQLNFLLLLLCAIVLVANINAGRIGRDAKANPGRRVSEVKCMEYLKYKKDHPAAFEPLIIGGVPTQAGEFPHMGVLGWKAKENTWVFQCGATLVSERFALTAGHCTLSRSADDPEPKIVRLGDQNILDQNTDGLRPVDAVIRRTIRHPEYKAPKKYNDLALIEFEKPVQFSPLIHPACLWGEPDISSLGSQATLSTWGVVETANPTSSPNLKKEVYNLIDNKSCDIIMKPHQTRLWLGLKDTQLCAAKNTEEKNRDACLGDSGSPLQAKTKPQDINYVFGVMSFGIRCSSRNKPDVFTRVSSYIDWIEETVWQPGSLVFE